MAARSSWPRAVAASKAPPLAPQLQHFHAPFSTLIEHDGLRSAWAWASGSTKQRTDTLGPLVHSGRMIPSAV
jgi:hypothetical protein